MELRKALSVLVIGLMTVPAWALPSSAVGTVEGSAAATVRGAALVSGTTLYSGDTVEVGARGNALISLAQGAQLALSADSQASIQKNGASDPVRVVVERGFAKFRRTQGAPVEAMLGNATVQTAGAEGVGFIHIVDANKAMIGAVKGNILVTIGDHTTTVPEGAALAVSPDGQSNQGSGGQQPGHVKTWEKILIGGLIIGGAIAAAVALNQSEPTQNPDLSPFKVQ
jgi:hypothetical protein